MNGLVVIGLWLVSLLVVVGVTALVETGRLNRIGVQVERLMLLADESDHAHYGTLSTEYVHDYLTRIEQALTPWWAVALTIAHRATLAAGVELRRGLRDFTHRIRSWLPDWLLICMILLLVFSMGAALGSGGGH